MGELVTGIQRQALDIDVTVVMHQGHPQGPPEVADLEDAGIDLVEMPHAVARIHALASRLRLPFPFNVVAPGKDVWLFPTLRRYPTFGTPAISFVYDLGYLIVPDCVHPDGLDSLRRNVPRLVARSDRIVAISETVRDDLIAAYPGAEDRTVVVPMAPASAIDRPPPHDWKARLDRLGLPGSGYLLHVGTVEPRKNLLPLISAVGHLPMAVVRDHPLVLVGPDGWSNDAEKRAIRDAGEHVRWLDFVSDEDLRALYEGAIGLVFPSRYEGFGVPVVEAMVTGTPVACADIPVLREVAGGAAAYFDNSDPRDIARTLRSLLSDAGMREDLIARGYERARDYSWARSAELLARTIREVAG